MKTVSNYMDWVGCGIKVCVVGRSRYSMIFVTWSGLHLVQVHLGENWSCGVYRSVVYHCAVNPPLYSVKLRDHESQFDKSQYTILFKYNIIVLEYVLSIPIYMQYNSSNIYCTINVKSIHIPSLPYTILP